jgi:1,4-alpha-glucan branching enzyme
MNIGSFIFVLHSHVPYVRKSGKWPHGEEMLYEIIGETYIPLLNAFDALYKDGIKPRVSLGLTPILLEQLHDPYMQREFIKYAKTRLKAAIKEHTSFKETTPEAIAASEFYINWYTKIIEDYEHKYDHDLISAFKFFQDKGNLDILTSAATHGYLPLLSRDSAIWGQLKTGIKQYKKYFDRAPSGIWLPECGYRPLAAENRIGIESFLDEMNLKYFFTDSHVIESAVHAGGEEKLMPQYKPQTSWMMYTNAFVLTHSTPKSSKKRKDPISFTPAGEISTFHPYFVEDSEVYVFGRDNVTGMQVWSSDWGYPGDFLYREFHKKSKETGIQYWKISNKKQGMKFKEYYIPKEAFAKAEEHAAHFSQLVKDHLLNYYSQNNKKGVVVSSYDTELFGHWWFEGVHWIEKVMRNFSVDDTVTLTSARDYVQDHPQTVALRLPESSWGNGGLHITWLNNETTPLWADIHAAEIKFEALVEKYPDVKGVKKKLLNQAARELLLLQSSDWPFLITTVQASDYATKRFSEHVNRFNFICDSIEDKNVKSESDKTLEEIFDVDNIFKEIDYRDFA